MKSVTTIGLRVAGAAAAAMIAGLAGTTAAATATAAPVAPTVVHQVSQLDDITYAAAFGAGVQVYQDIAPTPYGNGMVLQRVTSLRAGNPAAPKYAIIGFPLPALFASYNVPGKADLLGDIVYPIDPKTYEQVPGHESDRHLRLGFYLQHRIGAFADAAIAFPSLLPA
ncbi:hypothetical protein [Williamsia sterculiae]|uniref:Uncharacterized protein n=1 Tax=Williamsia sterculiae TaxID=1344003 RepID=A0A1N7DY11_9NOCA|nr:hypothetical protein [Williamsia sterculiae]SIR80730.1 hypothetical protein SAMN05445060_1009 [Williamsia sterculiae]